MMCMSQKCKICLETLKVKCEYFVSIIDIEHMDQYLSNSIFGKIIKEKWNFISKFFRKPTKQETIFPANRCYQI